VAFGPAPNQDLDELLELSDRLCVMFDGAIVHETKPGATDTITIGRYMAGSLTDRNSLRPAAD
jgi:simple sugar transport system ATP-binding protein